jgi:PAS domain S-box-containing protein
MPVTGEKRTARKNLDKSLSTLSALGQFSAALLSSRDSDQVLTEAVRNAKKILGARSCGIFLFDDRRGLEFKRGLGFSGRFQKTFDSRISRKLTKEVLNRVYPRISNDTSVGHKRSQSFRDLLRMENIHKEIGVPIKVTNKLIGILHIGRSSSYADFSQGDLTLLHLLSTQIAIAINKAERYQQLEKRSGVQESLIEGAPDPTVVVDLDGNVTYCNKAAELLTGYTKAELIGKDFSRLGSMEKRELARILKSVKTLRNGRKVVPFEVQAGDKNGKPHWLELHLSRVQSKGKTAGFQIMARDITECKSTEMALTRKERIATERARLLNDLRNLNQIDDVLTTVCRAVRDSGLFARAVMTLHKPGGKLTYLGQVGLAPSVVRRARQAPPIGDELRSRITNKRFRISDSFFVPAEAGLNYSGSRRYIPQKKSNLTGGDWRPGDELFVPLRDSSGEIMGYLSVDTPTDGCRPDLTSIQALEMFVEAGAARVREVEVREVLQRERDISRLILETANSLIVCLDADARITAFNRECEQVTGYRRKEVLDKRWPELFLPPEERHAKLKSFGDWVRAHPRDQYEGRIVTKKGEIRTILWSNTSILGSDEKEVLAIAIGHDITERKRAEEALQTSRERYQLSTRAANVGVWDWNVRTNEFYVDPNVKEILGYKDEEIPNDIDIWMTNVHPDDREPVMAAAQACLDGKTREYVIEHRMLHRNGCVRWIHSRGNVIRDEKGNAVRMVGTDTDITERRRVQEELKASENKYRTLLENLPQKIFLKDKNSVYLSCNANLARDFNIKAEEVAGKTDYDFFPKELADKYRADDKRIMKSGRAEDIEERYIQDEREVFVHTVKTPVKDEKGNLLGLLGIFWDVTERKQAEEALQESQERYRSLFEDSPISLWEEDFSRVKGFIDGLRARGVKNLAKHLGNHPETVAKCANMVKVLDVNNASLRLFKARKKEELQRSLGSTFSEESYDAFKDELMAIARGHKTFETEATTKTLQGDKKHVVVRWSVAPGYERTLSKVLVSVSDITELKRAREQNLLLETSKALSGALKLNQVLKTATEKMAKALKADRCAVAFTDPKVESATVKHVYLENGRVSPKLVGLTLSTLDFHAAMEVLRKDGYYRISDVGRDRIPESLRSYFLKAGVRSTLIIPMFVGGQLLGLFSVGSAKKPRSFGKEEIDLARTIANQVAVAVQNALLIEDLEKKHLQIREQSRTLERQYQEQAILMKISRALSQTLDLDRILQVATKEAAQALQVDRCAVALAFPEEGYAEVKSIHVKEGKPLTHLLGHRLYENSFPQAKEMFERRKLIKIPDTRRLPEKSFAKRYFRKEGIKSAVLVPMVHGKKLVGFFVLSMIKNFRTFTGEETKLAQTIADQVAVAIENARLLELVKKSGEDLKALAAQLITVQEDKGKKIAQELHDEVGQMLFAMKLNLDVIKKNLPADLKKLEDTENRLSDTESLLAQTIDYVRNLTTDLRPSMLDDFGLVPASKWHIDNFSNRTNIKVDLKTKRLKGRFPSEIETTFYRILQEALTNVAKHAQATEVTIQLARENDSLTLSVEDNGKGFGPRGITFSKEGLGLFSIKERIKLLNGEFEISSKANKGTRLNVRIPLTERRV